MNPESNNLRETLESAFEASEEQAGRSSTDTTESVGTPAKETAKPAERTTSSEDRGDGRGPNGRFVRAKPKVAAPDSGQSAAPDAGAAPLAGTAQQEPAKPAPVDHFAKAPQSWKPGAREAWSTLPPDVRAEVYRRERETATAIQQSAQAREVLNTVQQMQHDFGPALAAEGVDVVTATRNLMQISSRLRFGTPQEKAVTVAQIMQAYGVDVPTLDAILSNTPMPQHAQVQQQQLRDPRLDGLLSQIAQARQAQAQQVQQQAVSEVETFGQDKDFFAEVRETMADMLELAAKRGVDMTLGQAYERACQMDPEISRVLAQRAAAGQAQNQNRSTARAKAAASSVRSTPVTGGAPAQPENLRGALEAAWDSAAGE